MKRVILGTDTFYLSRPEDMYESSFEIIIKNHAKEIFPGFKCIPFKNTLKSSYLGSTCADLALIDDLYRHWWVVEIETIDHSLQNHVIPQMTRLQQADYSALDLAERVSKSDATLSLEQLKRLFKTVSPKFCVIANAYDAIWEQSLSRRGIDFIWVSTYRSITDRPLLSVSGEIKNDPPSFLSEILHSANATSHSAIRLQRSGVLSHKSDETIQIFINEEITSWKVIDVDSSIWLVPMGRYSLNTSEKYEFMVDHLGRYALEHISTR